MPYKFCVNHAGLYLSLDNFDIILFTWLILNHTKIQFICHRCNDYYRVKSIRINIASVDQWDIEGESPSMSGFASHQSSCHGGVLLSLCSRCLLWFVCILASCTSKNGVLQIVLNDRDMLSSTWKLSWFFEVSGSRH